MQVDSSSPRALPRPLLAGLPARARPPCALRLSAGLRAEPCHRHSTFPSHHGLPDCTPTTAPEQHATMAGLRNRVLGAASRRRGGIRTKAGELNTEGRSRVQGTTGDQTRACHWIGNKNKILCTCKSMASGTVRCNEPGSSEANNALHLPRTDRCEHLADCDCIALAHCTLLLLC